MTGMYEYKHGTNFGHGDMLKKTWENSYPVLLRKNGYRTAFAGKFGFDLREEPNGKRLPMPENDFDMWGGGPGQTNYSTAKNASMKHYAKNIPTPPVPMVLLVEILFSNLRRQTTLLFINQFQSSTTGHS